MRYLWDPAKDAQNQRKHGIAFADAVVIVDDPYALSREDTNAQGEQRFIVTGMDVFGRILTMVYTYTENEIRVISARRASAQERRAYERERF
jgi:uncharacterized DUF497 family protein